MSIFEKLKSFVSKKLLGTVLSTLIVMFGVDISPETQAQLITFMWGIYVAVQGYVDSK